MTQHGGLGVGVALRTREGRERLDEQPATDDRDRCDVATSLSRHREEGVCMPQRCQHTLCSGASGGKRDEQPRRKLVEREGPHRAQLLFTKGGRAHAGTAHGRDLQA